MRGLLSRREIVPPAAGAFALDAGWRLDDRVSIRPEPFGALLYHFGTRRLTFVKSRMLLEVVRGLAGQPSARAACVNAGVGAGELPQYAAALAALAAGEMIVTRDTVPPGRPGPAADEGEST